MNLLPSPPQAVVILLFLRRSRLPGGGNPYLHLELGFPANGWGEGGENEVMAHLNALLRSVRSRIGSRLAQIVAIAAASLPTAGA
jgi:hypothetical protein